MGGNRTFNDGRPSPPTLCREGERDGRNHWRKREKMQLVAVALIVGVIAYLIGVIFIVGHAKNRSVARSRSRASMVTAVLSGVDGRVRCQGAVDVDFSNRSARPVIVGLSVRADFFPGWPRVRHDTKVVSRPERRRYRADAQGPLVSSRPTESSAFPSRPRMILAAAASWPSLAKRTDT